MQYFAYGSNMNVSQTQQRCPGITRVGTFQLEGFRLVFNYHADIVPVGGVYRSRRTLEYHRRPRSRS